MATFWGMSNVPGDIADFMTSSNMSGVIRAELSKEVLKAAVPDMIFRRYVSKFADFTQNKGGYVTVYKRLNLPQNFTWTDVNESDPLPAYQLNYTRYTVPVSERGRQFPLTERASLMSNIDLEAEIKETASAFLVMAIETDILSRGLMYLDILGIADTGNAVTTSVGKTLAPTKTFNNTGEPGATSITITQATYDTVLGTIDGVAPQPLTLGHILEFSAELQKRYVPSWDGRGYGRYVVIMNRQARDRLITDPNVLTMLTRLQSSEYVQDGYIGSLYGQEIVVDNNNIIDTVTGGYSSVLQGKAICIFLGHDALREAIAKPEGILGPEVADYGRRKGFAVQTYRGEAPVWFASVDPIGGGGVLVGA